MGGPTGGGRPSTVLSALAVVTACTLAFQVAFTRMMSSVLAYHFSFLAISLALLGTGAGSLLVYVRPAWFDRATARVDAGPLEPGLRLLMMLAPLALVRVDYAGDDGVTLSFALNIGLACLLAALPSLAAGALVAMAIRGFPERHRPGLRLGPGRRRGRCAGHRAPAALPGARRAGGHRGGGGLRLGAPSPGRRAAVGPGARGRRRGRRAGRAEHGHVDPLRADDRQPRPALGRPLAPAQPGPGPGEPGQPVERPVLRPGLRPRAPRRRRPTARLEEPPPRPGEHRLRDRRAGPRARHRRRRRARHLQRAGRGPDRRRDRAQLGHPRRRRRRPRPPVGLALLAAAACRPRIGDGRAILADRDTTYDQIHIGFTDTLSANAAQGFALSENNLYTLEAFEEYLDHLSPSGILNVSRLEQLVGDEAIRVTVLTMAALEATGSRTRRGTWS